MAEVIRMPRLSDTMEEGVIVEWHKEEGDEIESGEVLAEVETDKATMEVDSYVDGILLHIGVKEGAVPVGGIIAVIGEEGEDWKTALKEAKSETKKKDSTKEKEATEEKEATKEKPADKKEKEKTTEKKEPTKTQPKETEERIKASPLARKMAEEQKIPLSEIDGSGEGGRIIKKDVEEYTPSPAAALTGEPYKEQEISQMRKTIARRLSESKFQAPHFYLTIPIDMSRTVSARKHINEKIAPDKISFNDIIIKAVALALRKHPAVNSSWQGNTIKYHNRINIGVAVAVEEGLVVPVIENVDLIGLRDINEQVGDVAEKARNKKLPPEKMQGNTFTISNLGMYGIEEFTAIINPPDACIMAVGAIMEKPVVENGQVVPGKVMKVTLSCDHRLVDGAKGAEFLQTFKSYMEEPLQMLV